MKTARPFIAIFLLLLLVIFPLAAGCLSVPGPESPKKTTPVTAAVTRSPQETATPLPAETQAAVATTKPTPAATAAATITTSPVKSGYATAACADLSGFVVTPGQQCKGTWLPAINTFSCCSVAPVKADSGNGTLSAAPFTMTINVDDSLGSITP
jgi:hypothetical protein